MAVHTVRPCLERRTARALQRRRLPALRAREAQCRQSPRPPGALDSGQASRSARRAAPILERPAQSLHARSRLRPARLVALPAMRTRMANRPCKPLARPRMPTMPSRTNSHGSEPHKQPRPGRPLPGPQTARTGARTPPDPQRQPRSSRAGRVFKPRGLVAMPSVRQRVETRALHAPSCWDMPAVSDNVTPPEARQAMHFHPPGNRPGAREPRSNDSGAKGRHTTHVQRLEPLGGADGLFALLIEGDAELRAGAAPPSPPLRSPPCRPRRLLLASRYRSPQRR